MAYQNFVIKVDRRQTRSHDPATDSFSVKSLTVDSVEINSTTIITSDNTKSFTNKTFDVDAAGNILSNITNTNIKAAAGIVETKLALDYSTSGLNTAVVAAQGDATQALADAATADGKAVAAQATADAALPKAGGTMSGAILMGTSKITGLGDGATGTQDAATVSQMETADGVLQSAIDALGAANGMREFCTAISGDAAPSEAATLASVLPFSDDDAPTLVEADFAANSHIIFGAGGTPVLGKVYDDAGTKRITLLGAALADEKLYAVKYNLLAGSAANESMAIFVYLSTGTTLIKVADYSWDTASGISLGSWTSGAGTVTSADNILQALQKLDGNTAAAQSDATQAIADAATADGKAVAAQSDATQALADAATADGKAVAAQTDADTNTASIVDLKLRAYTASSWANGSGTQAVVGDVGFVDTDGLVKPVGAGTTGVYKKRIVVCADATIDNAASGSWHVLPSRAMGSASGESAMVIGEEVYLSSTAGEIEQDIGNITAGHAIMLVGYAIAAGDWEFIRPEYLGDA